MEKVGSAIILIETNENVQQVNKIISNHSQIIIGRLGLPRSTGHGLISLFLKVPRSDWFTYGRLGRLSGIQIKSVLLKNMKDE